MKIFVGIPIRDNRIGVHAFHCLLRECEIARCLGDELVVSFLHHCSLLAHGRNTLVARFMASDSDRLVFVDDDMSWEPGALVKLAHRPEQVVGGAGRAKFDDEVYCVTWLDIPELWSNEHGSIEVKALGCAFLAVSRTAIETIEAAYPERAYGDSAGEVFCHFSAPFIPVENKFYGEDAAFCHLWASVGGKVYIDPEISLGHWDGKKEYRGTVGQWLRARIADEQVAEVA